MSKTIADKDHVKENLSKKSIYFNLAWVFMGITGLYLLIKKMFHPSRGAIRFTYFEAITQKDLTYLINGSSALDQVFRLLVFIALSCFIIGMTLWIEEEMFKIINK